MMFYTYILFSEFADKQYIGQTSNIQERLQKHNNKNKGFTNQANDWVIVYQKSFVTRTEAMSHEKEIKKWKSRKMIRNLIENQ